MRVSGTILYVNPPKGNGRSWSLKIGNTYVGISAQDATQFRKGDNVTLEVSERNHNGKTYYEYVSVAGAQQSPPPPPPAQRSNGAASPPQSSRGGASNDQMIFITGIVGRSMQSGQFGLEDILALTDAAKNAYERVILGKTVAPDFNDSIDHIGQDQDDPGPPF